MLRRMLHRVTSQFWSATNIQWRRLRTIPSNSSTTIRSNRTVMPPFGIQPSGSKRSSLQPPLKITTRILHLIATCRGIDSQTHFLCVKPKSAWKRVRRALDQTNRRRGSTCRTCSTQTHPTDSNTRLRRPKTSTMNRRTRTMNRDAAVNLRRHTPRRDGSRPA
uniref:(northern house mosquito) hypothetical protein n=1 Tax=Culex pipiens TaxID=7175 RepID=A0A8D8F072_CULPI